MQTHTILGGKVQLFKRGQVWFARASVNKQQIKNSTGGDSLSLAQQMAEDWYLGLRGKSRAGLPLKEVREATFNDMADLFEVEYEIITEGERSLKWVAGHKARLRAEPPDRLPGWLCQGERRQGKQAERPLLTAGDGKQVLPALVRRGQK